MSEEYLYISRTELARMLSDAAEFGAMKALEKVGFKDKDLISQNQAYRLFGRSNVNRWLTNKLITGRRRGISSNSKIAYSKSELIIIERSETHAGLLLDDRKSRIKSIHLRAHGKKN